MPYYLTASFDHLDDYCEENKFLPSGKEESDDGYEDEEAIMFSYHPAVSTDSRQKQASRITDHHQSIKHQMSNAQQQHYLTIEELRLVINSCWLCGCNWQQDHTSLDCRECGGYALTRPCPNCDGNCKQTWKRNITATHDLHRDHWVGRCNLNDNTAPSGVTKAKGCRG